MVTTCLLGRCQLSLEERALPGWIVPFRGREYSGAYDQNFVWGRGNVYIMDNHRAAFWCWLQHLEDYSRVQLFHIDRHTDTLYSRIDTWLPLCPDVRSMSLPSYLDLTYNSSDCGDVPLFRWDNYLSLFLEKHGRQVTRCYFATHKEGDGPRHKHIQFVPPWDLPGNINFWISEGSEPFIVRRYSTLLVFLRCQLRSMLLQQSQKRLWSN